MRKNATTNLSFYFSLKGHCPLKRWNFSGWAEAGLYRFRTYNYDDDYDDMMTLILIRTRYGGLSGGESITILHETMQHQKYLLVSKANTFGPTKLDSRVKTWRSPWMPGLDWTASLSAQLSELDSKP